MLQLQVTSLRDETDLIKTITLCDAGGRALPTFTAGSHLNLHLDNGMTRTYSLLNAETCRDRYEIGVARDPASRGGSVFIHEHVAVGDVIASDEPANDFPLTNGDDPVVLIAGGIGVTPFLSMAKRLEADSIDWKLIYCDRTRARAAYLDRVQPHGDRVELHFDDERQGRYLDLAGVIAGAAAGTHFYCCGPLPMIAAFRAACAGTPPSHVHVESFLAAEHAASDGGFTVELAKSGKSLLVPRGRTILETLKTAGFAVNSSCERGSCGACETKVLRGRPDHRDGILSMKERAAGKTMMICCSGSLDATLVLDI